MKWLVTGGRRFGEIRFVYDKLDGVAKEHGMPSLLIHGAAPGVDSIAARWAQLNNVEPYPVPIEKEEWRRFGRAAGPIRNSRMMELEPDLGIVFPGHSGTLDMYNKLKRADVPIAFFGSDCFI